MGRELITNPAYIIDLGSCFTKHGPNTFQKPEKFQSLICSPWSDELLPSQQYQKKTGPSKEEQALYELSSVFVNGELENKISHEILIKRCLQSSQDDNSNQYKNIIFSERINKSETFRHNTLETMFEQYDMEGVSFHQQPQMSLFAFGLLNGLILDSGDHYSQGALLINGQIHQQRKEQIQLGGQQVTKQLYYLMRLGGYYLNTKKNSQIYREIKESTNEIKINIFYHNNLKNVNRFHSTQNIFDENLNIVLPDGKEVQLTNEHILSNEVLFTPSSFGLDCPGLQDFLYQLISNLDEEYIRLGLRNVVLSGGNCLIKGIDDRMQKELINIQDQDYNIRIQESKWFRDYSSWLGAQVIS